MSSKEYMAEWHQRNKSRRLPQILARNKVNRAENRSLIQEAKSGPCTDCGRSYPYYVMHFDHLHGKKLEISAMLGYSRDAILLEIAKCELVCANCHAERTHQRASLAEMVKAGV